MGKRREKHKFLRAQRSKERKKKKKTGSKGTRQERKDKTKNTIYSIAAGSILIVVIGLMAWANIFGRQGMNTPIHTAFQLICYIDIDTFDVEPEFPFYETWRQTYIGNRAVDSYPTATLEISRAVLDGPREYFDVIRNVWADEIYMMENGVLRPQNRTYNIISIHRDYFEQTIPCYVRDQIGIEVRQFENNDPYTATLKYHYTIAGSVSGNAAQVGQYNRIQSGVSTVQETMAQDLSGLSKIFNPYGTSWAGRCTRYS